MSTVDYEITNAETQVREIAAREKCRSLKDIRPNVGAAERGISGILGGCLVGLGLGRKSLVGTAAALVGAGFLHRAITGHCYAYEGLGIDTARRHNRAVGVKTQRGQRHESSIVINRPAGELFEYWRKLNNLPKLFDHLLSVVEAEDGRSHWVARGPLDKSVEWDAEIHNQVPDRLITWRSISGSQFDTAGAMHFKPTPDGGRTIVTLSMKYDPPAGKIGSAIADWLGQSVDDEIDDGLRRFKQVAETGELPTIAGQPHGTCASS